MTIEQRAETELDRALLRVLRSATGTTAVAFAEPPRPLTGGYWAQLVAFQLTGAPVSWQGELVARVMPDPWIAAKETAVQSAMADHGYPTPTVHAAGGPDDGLGQAFMVMDLAPGAPLLTGLNGARALVALPRLARYLPDLLATTMAQLHGLDPQPVRDRLVRAGIREHGLAPVLDGLRAGGGKCNRADLVAAADWLRAHPPKLAQEVVCHGDLHPFNLLVTPDGHVTVLDWSAALLAPALYDVAFTNLILSEPPVAVPAALRPMVRAAGRALARRFRRNYARAVGGTLDRQALAWCEAVICLRALVEVAHWVAAGELDTRRGHPWLLSGSAFATTLSGLTGHAVAAC